MSTPPEHGVGDRGNPLLTDAIAAIAEHSAERTAIVGAGESWSFRRLVEEARAFARAIVDHSSPGERVGVCGPRTPRTVAAALGCLFAGRVYLPLDPGHAEHRLALVIEDADPALLLFDGPVPEPVGRHARARSLDATAKEVNGPRRETARLPVVGTDDVAYVIYTSGSTGRPKGVLAQHGALAALAEAIGDHRPGLGDHDVVLAVASFAFDMVITDVFVPLARGASVVLAPDARDTAHLLDLIDRHGVTTIFATPSLWRTLVDGGLGTGGRRKVRAVGGGERLTTALAHELQGRTERLYNGYGPTETTVYVTFGEVEDPDDVTLGGRVPSCTLHVLDDRLGVVPPGGRGELHVGGTAVGLGYHRRPALTAATFLPDPYSDHPGARLYCTGDIVTLREDGELEFVGRSDSQVKIRGHRVEPGEVEAVAAQHPDVREAVVLVTRDPAGEKSLTISWVGGENATPESLRTHLRHRLPPAMVPTSLLPVPAFPITANGKVDRDALRTHHAMSPLSSPSGTSDDESGPDLPDEAVSEVGRELRSIWSSVLGADEPSPDADFFHLGGHSVLAMEAVARIRDTYDVELPVWELFGDPSLRNWTSVVERSLQEAQEREEPSGAPDATTARQRSYLELERRLPGAVGPHPLIRCELSGPVDSALVVEALACVVRRHEPLRTTFPDPDSPVVSEFVELEMSEVDLRSTAPAQREEAMGDLERELARRPRDPVEPPVHALLVMLTPERFRLAVAVPDSVGDVGSRGPFLRDFARAYALAQETLTEGSTESPLMAWRPAVEYRELLALQNRSDADEANLAFWRETLPRATASGTEDCRTSTVPVRVPADVVEHLRDVALFEDSDLRTLLLTGLTEAMLVRQGGHPLLCTVNGARDGAPGSVAPLSRACYLPPAEGSLGEPSAIREGVSAAMGHVAEHPVAMEAVAADLQLRGETAPVPDAGLVLREPLPRIDAPTPEVTVAPLEDEAVVDADDGPLTALPYAFELCREGAELTGVLQYRTARDDAASATAIAERFIEALRKVE